ncbi:neutral zinc metallopeptidase [Kangiella sp.]|uniref:KPN_02809 family neutral zinc metallopeptidase n=1 Tax=Kangiella sp. TaxID=1920245 RepID=UPI0019B572C9|nr:neutral zinc metallopeptidase [Kangiella sp.]MBD3654312.1 neutral zinc metallopeptidase [Kangiella sp.]
MKWRGRRRSSNVDDRRGQRMKSGSKLSIGGIIIAAIAIFVFKQDPMQVISGLMGTSGTASSVEQTNYKPSPQEQETFDFVSVILADTEDTWSEIFSQSNQQYPKPSMVIYRDMTPTACGTGQAASGPFYCPADQQVYLDLSFIEELEKMGGSGDFAIAYVIAHEVGHHIQTIIGISQEVRQKQSQLDKAGQNALQVKMELQADCLAGVWANHTHKRTQFLEAGDLEEALAAAEAVGDDTLMKRAGVAPRREAFTHGSAQERMQWFSRGVDTGSFGACDTFGE